jgi:spermidine/putrescine transport system permease protein
MKAAPIPTFVFVVYIACFLAFLLGPLAIMAMSSINTASYPQAWPVEGLTLTWFHALLSDQEIQYGLMKSVWTGILVVCLSIPCGLAGAIVMTQIVGRARSFYYVFAVAPILMPGVVIGISTIVFWRDFSTVTGIRSLVYNGVTMTVLAQSSFIASQSMLIILARLQRFDAVQEEAALDLGASHSQAFRDVLLPFLRPAIVSSAALGFLASFENYNTTTFSILSDKTLTTILAARVRMGSTPSISAIGTLIVLVTILAAIFYEILKRRQARREMDRSSAADLVDRADRWMVERQ